MNIKTTTSAFIGILLGALLSATAHGEIINKRTEILKKTSAVTIKLDSTTVLCSRADYAGDFLKILIPNLAELTVLDHRNFGAGAPCVASGMCIDGNMPSDILNDSRTEETVPITVVLTKATTLNTTTGVCHVTLEEYVEAPVRGKIFKHARYAQLDDRTAEDCK